MRELRLKYFIELLSNIEAKAGSDAKALGKAQAQIQKELGDTQNRLSRYEQVLARIGGVHNASLQQQARYFGQIAQSALRAQEAVDRYGKAAGKVQNFAVGAVAGTAAAGYVVKTALDKPIDYDTRLRGAASTAYAGQDLAGLRKGLVELEALINTTVKATPGASREGALGAYEKLVGTGAFTDKESRQLLAPVMRTSVASGAGADDLVQAAEKMKVNFGLTPEQVALGLSKIMRAGQEGGFEIKDSAKWIGPLAPMMKGYKGLVGVEAMVTMLQQVRSTAGSNDEAANNLRNFLQKIGADSTRKDFKKAGIDLPAEMAAGAVRGESPVDIYMALLEKIMAKQDPEGKARKAMLAADKSATPEEKAQRYEDVKNIYRTAGLATIINDLQEMGGYTGLAGTKEYGKKVLGAVQAENGSAVDTGYQFMAEGLGAKSTAAGAEKDKAMSDAMHSVEGPLGTMLDGATGLAQEFPRVAQGAAAASVALGALAAAAVAASITGGGSGAAAKVGGWLAGAAGSLGALFGAGKFAAAAGPTGGTVARVAGSTMAAGGLAKMLGLLNPLMLIEALTGPSEEDIARLRVMDQLKAGYRGKGFVDPRRLDGPNPVNPADFLTLTAPGAASQSLGAGKTTEIKVGDGRMLIDVRVSDDRAPSALFTVQQQPSLIKINPGATNPGSLPR